MITDIDQKQSKIDEITKIRDYYKAENAKTDTKYNQELLKRAENDKMVK